MTDHILPYMGYVDGHIRSIVLNVDPVPWKIGPLVQGRRAFIGPSKELQNYQDAVRVLLHRENPEIVAYRGRVDLAAFFWRKTAGLKPDSSTGHADATNLMKGFEDALQGVVFENDRMVVLGVQRIAEQGPSVVAPGVVAYIRASSPEPFPTIHGSLEWGLLLQGVSIPSRRYVDEEDEVGF